MHDHMNVKFILYIFEVCQSSDGYAMQCRYEHGFRSWDLV